MPRPKFYGPSSHRPAPNQPELFDGRRPDLRLAGLPCPGCGAKPGEYRPSERFRWVLGLTRLCDECASIPEVIGDHFRDDPPQDWLACPYPCGDDRKIEWMAGRAAEGLSIFSDQDSDGPAPFKVQRGAPDYRHNPGETGIEKCGVGYRVRPFWRGRKWPLGVFSTEAEAIDRARRFWRLHGKDDQPRPVIWMPTADEDHAVAVEWFHLQEWVERFGPDLSKKGIRKVLFEFRKELRKRYEKLPTLCVWELMEQRLATATDAALFGLVPGGPKPVEVGA